ncbi:MAG: FliM/FliN family flagellar motor switch protein [Pseudomonadota bacterium]
MTLGAHPALRQKIGDSRVGRPPIGDIDQIGDLFSRLLENRLKRILRVPVVASVSTCRVRKLKATLGEVSSSCLLAQAESKSRPFAAAAVLDDVLVEHLIEAASGGRTKREVTPGTRKLTKMDEYLSQDFAITLIDCFEDAIATPPRQDGEALRFSRFAKSVKTFMDIPDDMDVLTYTLTLQFESRGPELELLFLVPLNVLDVLRASSPNGAISRMSGFGANADSLWNKTMTAAASQAQLKLVGVLAQFPLTIEEVNELEPGSLIELPAMTDMIVDLKIDEPGGVTNSGSIGCGALGADNGNRAVKLTEDLDHAFDTHLKPVRDICQTHD